MNYIVKLKVKGLKDLNYLGRIYCEYSTYEARIETVHWEILRQVADVKGVFKSDVKKSDYVYSIEEYKQKDEEMFEEKEDDEDVWILLRDSEQDKKYII